MADKRRTLLEILLGLGRKAGKKKYARLRPGALVEGGDVARWRPRELRIDPPPKAPPKPRPGIDARALAEETVGAGGLGSDELIENIRLAGGRGPIDLEDVNQSLPEILGGSFNPDARRYTVEQFRAAGLEPPFGAGIPGGVPFPPKVRVRETVSPAHQADALEDFLRSSQGRRLQTTDFGVENQRLWEHVYDLRGEKMPEGATLADVLYGVGAGASKAYGGAKGVLASGLHGGGHVVGAPLRAAKRGAGHVWRGLTGQPKMSAEEAAELALKAKEARRRAKDLGD